jgi:hypothetical protein
MQLYTFQTFFRGIHWWNLQFANPFLYFDSLPSLFYPFVTFNIQLEYSNVLIRIPGALVKQQRDVTPTRRSVVMTTRAEKCEEWKNLTPFPIPVGIISHSIEKKNRVQDTLGSHSIPIIYLISFRLLESCYYAKGNLFGISRTPGIFLLFGGHLTATE